MRKIRVKTKLSLGLGFLFTVIVLLSVLGVYYVSTLSRDAMEILEDNYDTVAYMQGIQKELQADTLTPDVMDRIDSLIVLQENNLTEAGEKEATDELRTGFIRFRNDPSDRDAIQRIRQSMSMITALNMEAIQRKNLHALKTSDEAILVFGILSGLCFVIAFSFIINFPGYIANPIRELTDSMKEIARKKYTTRLNFASGDEFGELAEAFNKMAKKLNEYEHSNIAGLLMEKKRIEALIQEMHDPVIGLDQSNHILFANEQALKVLSIEYENIIGKHVNEVSLRNDLMRSLATKLIDGKQTEKSEPLRIYSDNKESFFEPEVISIDYTPTGETESQHMGSVIILKNVTSFKELDVAKTNFIAAVSHELKTPIASIKMGLQLLGNNQTGKLNTEQQKLVSSIQEDADRLLHITGELLNITQVESDKITLNRLPCDAVDLLKDAVLANKVAADQKHISLRVDIPEDTPEILADKEKTAWVLTNLVSNAIRYSHENSVVHLKVRSQNGSVLFSVTDTGQGIAPQFLSRIFERYYRIPGNKKEGTGLGLSISKEFVEAQGGKIDVQSEVGSGSTFLVSLPVAPQ
jgi:signal transduction histidine kinase